MIIYSRCGKRLVVLSRVLVEFISDAFEYKAHWAGRPRDKSMASEQNCRVPPGSSNASLTTERQNSKSLCELVLEGDTPPTVCHTARTQSRHRR